ncbi:putative Ig domain-containing protein [Rheinheimera pacifica]|uniref:putative Ig domain-containing protein n=1 Tax=Rheinheimera pacifica TaxID=173990 RepID=UPI002ED932DC
MYKALIPWLPRYLALGGLGLLSLPVLAAIPEKSEYFSWPQAESTQQNIYVVELKAATATAISGVTANRQAELQQQQEDLLQQLYERFAEVELHSRNTLLGNSITLSLTAAQAFEVGQMAGVKRINLASDALPLSVASSWSQEPQPGVTALTTMVDTSVGKGVKIALISTGVDYTHASLGGPGTPEAYQKAWQYAGVPFDGFPTKVITKGWDFYSERDRSSAYADMNPIDSALDSNGQYGGRGTALASIIHQLAPGAELWVGKVYRASRFGGALRLGAPNTDHMRDALEWALDPNRDGDISDRADIIVLDVAGFGPGFYSEQDVWTDAYAAMAQNIQKAAALGALVLVPQGVAERSSSYMTPIQAVAPAALAVGLAQQSADTATLPAVLANSLHGPVRGDVNAIKPDLVGLYQPQQVALVGTGIGVGVSNHHSFTLARTAAMAAALKSARPTLNGLELKALLMNTANNQLSAADGEQLAEISWIGAGLEDATAATASPAVAWELASGLPSLHLGNPEVLPGKHFEIRRELYIRNLSDKPLTYTLSAHSRAGGPDTSALSWQLPSEVTIPAKRAVTVPVILTIDGSFLPKWPLITAADYNQAQWRASEMDGYLTLNAGDDTPALQLPWLVRPRPAADIQRHFNTYRERFPSFSGEAPPFPLGESLFDGNYFARELAFENTSAHAMTFTALPLVARNAVPYYRTVGAKGAMVLQNLASAVVADSRCEAGQKLTLAVTFFNPRALPFRSYFDTELNGSLDMFIVRNEILTDYPDMSVQDLSRLLADKDMVLEAFVDLNEHGGPVAYYRDLNIAIDPSNPAASLKTTKLPVRFATDSRNLMVDYCLEELVRDDLTLADLNQNLGYLVKTERDALPSSTQDPLIAFNPVNMGQIGIRYVYDWFGNVIEEIDNQANYVALSKEGGSTPLSGYSNEITLAPGDRATLTVVADGYCEAPGRWQCGRGFILLADEADFHIWSTMTQGNDHGFVAAPRQGQQFSVMDNAEPGQLVGVIQLDSDAFFNQASSLHAEDYALHLVSPLPDNALRVTRKGEILVDDASVLNADGISSYHLKVFGQLDKSEIFKSPTVEVLVKVNSSNISPPVLSNPASAKLSGTAGASLNFDLSALFDDAEDDTLSFSATALPQGLTLETSSGKLSGRIATAGNYEFVVNVSDGRHQVAFAFSLNLTAAPSGGGSSGGAFGSGMLLMLLVALRRRFAHRI